MLKIDYDSINITTIRDPNVNWNDEKSLTATKTLTKERAQDKVTWPQYDEAQQQYLTISKFIYDKLYFLYLILFFHQPSSQRLEIIITHIDFLIGLI